MDAYLEAGRTSEGWTSRLMSLRKGERVRFRVDPLGDGCDRATWDPTIEYHQWPARGELDIMEHPPGVAARRCLQPLPRKRRHSRGPLSSDRAWLVSWVDWYPDRLEYFTSPGPVKPAPSHSSCTTPRRSRRMAVRQGHYLILHDKIKSTSPNGTERSLPAFPTAFRVDYVRVWEYTCGDATEPGE